MANQTKTTQAYEACPVEEEDGDDHHSAGQGESKSGACTRRQGAGCAGIHRVLPPPFSSDARLPAGVGAHEEANLHRSYAPVHRMHVEVFETAKRWYNPVARMSRPGCLSLTRFWLTWVQAGGAP